jgi:TonB family protein
MRTNLKNAKRISAIIFAAAVISSSLYAQSSNTMPKAKFVSFSNERESTLAHNSLSEITKAIEEKIKFKAPVVNDSESLRNDEFLSDANLSKTNSAYKPEKDKNKRIERKSGKNNSKTFRNWVEASLVYHLSNLKTDVSGTVIVSFIVDEKGQVSNVKVLSSTDKEVEKVVLDVINSAPKWASKKMMNQPLKQKFTLPISYKVIL